MRQTDKIEWTPQPKCAESDRPNEPNNKKLTTNQTIEIHGQFTPFPIRSDCRQFSVMLHKYTRANNNNEKMFGDFFFPTWDNQQRRRFGMAIQGIRNWLSKTKKHCYYLLFGFYLCSDDRQLSIEWGEADRYIVQFLWTIFPLCQLVGDYLSWLAVSRETLFASNTLGQFFKCFSMLYNKIGYGACLMATVKNYWCWLNMNIVNFQWKSCS